MKIKKSYQEFIVNLKKWYRDIGWVRRRIIAILCALGMAWLITGILIYFTASWAESHSSELLIGVLSAWTGELLFFSVVGAVVSVITLRDPAREVFDERVRILFGNGPDSVLSYNKRTLARLSAYAETGTRSVVIEEFNATWQAYRLRVKTRYVYKNLLHDVDYEDTLPWAVTSDALLPNPPQEFGRVISIKLNGIETIQNSLPIDVDGYSTELRLQVPANQKTTVELEYWLWAKAGEVQNMRPRRVVEQFTMSLVNQANTSPRLEIDGDQRGPISLLYN